MNLLNGIRPHLIDQHILGSNFSDPDQSVPRAAFRFIQSTELSGPLGRNTIRRGCIAHVNAALLKTWNAPRQVRINFRAESINLFHTPQFGEPLKELASPSFGLIQNTLNDGRTFRFTLRMSF